MPATFEDLRILKSAEEIADSIWKTVVQWDDLAKDVVGKQMAKSADSILSAGRTGRGSDSQ
jgi:hypothetical protein